MRFGTIIFVFFAMTAVWMSMAESIQRRHLNVDSQLRADVANLWGSTHLQKSAYLTGGPRLESADIDADIELEYRKKGHYWYSTYKVDFHALYQLPVSLPEGASLEFPLPAGGGLFNDFQVLVDGKPTEEYTQSGSLIRVPVFKGAKEVQVNYSGRGSEEWWYIFESSEGAPKNLTVDVKTNFREVDFIDGSVSPDNREEVDDGWKMTWNYRNLLTGSQIGVEMPKKPNPGPALIDICRYGPLGLLLFFTAVAICSVADGRSPHPMHFAFLGAGFFSFHLLLVYLGDVVGVSGAFGLAALVAILLNYHYGTLALGVEFARTRLLPVLFLYLVLFSATFMVEGKRGLLLVMLMIFSLHLLMRVSGKVDWSLLDRSSPAEESSSL
ncbi:MAG: inner membrane CreD family protein [Candidatus Eremiobacteraeota bacterium]|nr:inner membrane CreD family protein [Candidatus Eremiobacteraeota bacterium]